MLIELLLRNLPLTLKHCNLVYYWSVAMLACIIATHNYLIIDVIMHNMHKCFRDSIAYLKPLHTLDLLLRWQAHLATNLVLHCTDEAQLLWLLASYPVHLHIHGYVCKNVHVV